ncbi:MAG: TrbC/VirB2 family protein [Clostridia bacterium]|nr:TrbC/VirB2 family protein [Clostridia bacterium]
MKKSIKVALMIVAILLVSTSVFAADFRPTDVKNIINTEGTQSVKSIGGSILGIIRVVGTIVAVGMLIVLGIKYMMGSAEERAEYKKTLFPYLIGAVLIFAASNLADMVYSWAEKIGGQ